jgi:hypothetical protein
MHHTTTHTDKGSGLARGPALIIGTLLTAFGLALFLKNGATPNGGFPDGDINGPTFLGFETNGWTAWITTAAGALLLLGAAQHLFAKAMSLVVGLALLAAAIIGLVDGDVLGIAAVNHWTELGWGIAGALLLLNLFAPRERRRHRDVVVDDEVHARDSRVTGREDATAVTPAPRTTRTEEPVARETVRRDETQVHEHLTADDLERRDAGVAGEPVRVGDGREERVVESTETGRRSSRFRRG